jgi:hypothetical protein
MQTEARSRNLAAELTGLVLSLLAGSAAGMLVPIKAEGGLATVVTFAAIGAVVWTRRRQPPRTTIAVCFLLLVLGWPIVFVLLDWLHQYY